MVNLELSGGPLRFWGLRAAAHFAQLVIQTWSYLTARVLSNVFKSLIKDGLEPSVQTLI